MPSAKYTEVYKKVSSMGEKLKAAGKQGPSNDEQLKVCVSSDSAFKSSSFHIFYANLTSFILEKEGGKERKQATKTKTH
jgi:hypothetical protein